MGGIIEPTRTIGDFDVKDRLPPRALSIEPEIGVYSLSSLFASSRDATASPPAVSPGQRPPSPPVSSNLGLLLLATDGVWDFVDPPDVLKCVQQVKPLWRTIEAAAKRETELLLRQQQQKQQGGIPTTSLGRRVASASDFTSLIRSSLGGGSNSTNKTNQQQPLMQQLQQQQHQSVPSGLRRISSWRRLLPSQANAAPHPAPTTLNNNASYSPYHHSSSPLLHAQHQQHQQHEATGSSAGGSPQGAAFEPPTPQILSQLCRLIVKKALKKGSTDDCTCLAAFIYPVTPGPPPVMPMGGGLPNRTVADCSEGSWPSLT